MEHPKYYRCIKSSNHDFTLDKIYQIVNPNNLEDIFNFICNTGEKSGWGGRNYTHFTPVTEHEWNLQEGIIAKVSTENHSQLNLILKKLHVK